MIKNYILNVMRPHIQELAEEIGENRTHTAEINKDLLALIEVVAQIGTRESIIEECLKRIDEATKEKYDAKRNSSEPWVDIKSEGFDENGIRLVLDWNDAMVKYLRENGYSGKTDDEIVDQWIRSLGYGNIPDPSEVKFR